MKTRIALLISLIAVLILGACAPAATPTTIASQARATQTSPKRESEPTQAPAPTKAPEATQAPAAGPAPTMVAPAPNNGAPNYFQDPGVNPRERTLQDHLSTFALDVDTASYTLAKEYIQRGELPPVEAVRAEEVINALDQGYAAPSDAAFTIYADGAPSPFAKSGQYLVRVGVQGYPVSNRERKPSHLTFVVDASGSMQAENRLELVKRSLRLLVNRLNERDTVAIVVYGTRARILLEATPGAQHATILDAIDLLGPEGSTNVEAGLRLGYQLALEELVTADNNRVILCSDGVANTGNVDADALVEMVRGYVQEGISLVSIGVGMGNYNDVLMERLADGSNGSYHYVNDFEEARRVFVEDLTATLQVIAYDAKVQVDFNTDTVAKYRLIGYENRAIADQDFRNDSVDAGEVGAGMSATALYEVQLQPGAEGRIATVQLRWQDPDTREVKEIDGNIHVSDLAGSFENTDPHFQLTAAAAAWAELLRASPYVHSDFGTVARFAFQAAQRMPENQQAREFADLALRTSELGLGAYPMD